MEKKQIDLATIGGRIAFVRGSARQEDFASRLGVSRMTVVRYEKGDRLPDAAFLTALVNEFGVDPGWLLIGGEPPKPQLTPREAALLDNYRHCPEDAQRNLETTSALLAQSQGENKLKDVG